MELLPSPIKQLALAQGVPVFQPVKIRAADSVAHIRSLGADVIMVMAYGQILPKGRARCRAPRLLESARVDPAAPSRRGAGASGDPVRRQRDRDHGDVHGRGAGYRRYPADPQDADSSSRNRRHVARSAGGGGAGGAGRGDGIARGRQSAAHPPGQSACDLREETRARGRRNSLGCPRSRFGGISAP